MPLSKAIERIKYAARREPPTGVVILSDGLYRYSLTRATGTFGLTVSGRVLTRQQIEDVLVEQNAATPAQAKVAVLIAAGCTKAAIARKLRISHHTVLRHSEALFERHGAKTRVDLAQRITGMLADLLKE
jgi:DNA-binding NarL/FixJ family response regulator